MKSLRYLYKIGRGPSSSHTMGPEKASKIFKSEYPLADRFEVTLYGSLSATGKGHLTDKVISETLGGDMTDIIFGETEGDFRHPNKMMFRAFKSGEQIGEETFYSVGGGAIETENGKPFEEKNVYPHGSFDEIKTFCEQNNLKLWEYAEIFEDVDFFSYLKEIWEAMKNCIKTGLSASGVLPGELKTERKAKTLFEQYALNESSIAKQNRIVCAYAFACSETNASGGTVVTAPTCGSCGVLPAVLFYLEQKNEVPEREILKALACAGIIGNLVKTNASISGAECGCQAEIGVACAMASAAVAELYGMNLDQIEYAAEIAIEHHLGLTCDPICGLVQIPCIERNAVAALRALNEVTLPMFITGSRKISFDDAVRTMYETGRDLGNKYRETAKGGLAKLFKE